METRLHSYHIRVRGHLDLKWEDWFDGFKIKHIGDQTLLSGRVSDQAALHGVFAKIRDLGLIILLVERLDNHGD